MGDKEHAGGDVLLELVEQDQHLLLDGHIQGGGGLVGDQEGRLHRHDHGDHDTLTQAAGELEGELLHPVGRVGDAHLFQIAHGGVVGLFFAHVPVENELFRHLTADGEQGIEGGHGLLKDHAHLLAPHRVPLPGGHGGQLLPVELNAAGDHPAVARQQVHDGQGGDALAAAGFAHHAERLVLLDVKGDAPQDFRFFFVDAEGGDQVLHFKHFFPHGASSSETGACSAPTSPPGRAELNMHRDLFSRPAAPPLRAARETRRRSGRVAEVADVECTAGIQGDAGIGGVVAEQVGGVVDGLHIGLIHQQGVGLEQVLDPKVLL